MIENVKINEIKINLISKINDVKINMIEDSNIKNEKISILDKKISILENKIGKMHTENVSTETFLDHAYLENKILVLENKLEQTSLTTIKTKEALIEMAGASNTFEAAGLGLTKL